MPTIDAEGEEHRRHRRVLLEVVEALQLGVGVVREDQRRALGTMIA
jgi:hypothetical protein